MKKILILLVVVSVSGCSLNRQFVKAVNGFTTTILPEYKEYIKKDSSLDEDTKRIRTQSADKLQEIINSAKEEEIK